ncbi:Gfo/Idh/MocA family protein [Algoriphagus pacificus]|uniref:Gfo/Idh/MocA family oxidoreductase n=1 Tax=Algoriphagus pacificus TaxID=2811234 RepID=A0ABS3CJ15_9BACT|nr:Gfo/Idh/MocA family oxidoreductase [Algoriphagus pacificus]MBN7817092.1 Gfo/Idh/MocA family oxidoreductase [Algoriphagus pacificus]
MRYLLLLLIFLSSVNLTFSQDKLRVGVAGLTHGHVGWILDANKRTDIEIVGIAEPNKTLAERLTKQYGISMDLVYDDLEEMLTATRPEAVTAFGNIYDHLAVVEAAAPKRMHVMVEKPLAVSAAHASRMEELAKKHGIHLITNYETTWYPSVEKAQEILEEGEIGEMRKLIVRDGHRGPKNIGVSAEFLEWLTDPKLNGGGAIIDFGCYGANLSTWLHKGERPISVTAVAQQLQAENNPKVDDDATIILAYENSQVILEPSWNWPIGRKDMEIYGMTGALFADNGKTLRLRMAQGYDGFDEKVFQLEKRESPYDDPFTYFKAIIRGEIKASPYDLSSLENNLLVVEILEAAVESSKTNKTVFLK